MAQVNSGMVRADGAILEIGTLSAQTVGAALKQPVKKSGRTRKLTRSKVNGLNATIRVVYENACAGGASFTKTFTGQIVIANRGSGFLRGEDSGSLMVEDVATNPRAVGLLYAGGSNTAIANPIDEVLQFLGDTLGGPGGPPATMVGNWSGCVRLRDVRRAVGGMSNCDATVAGTRAARNNKRCA